MHGRRTEIKIEVREHNAKESTTRPILRAGILSYVFVLLRIRSLSRSKDVGGERERAQHISPVIRLARELVRNYSRVLC